MPQKTILRPQVCPAYSTPPFPDPWQIDKKWKSKLQSAMPTEEGLKLMTPKDPVIHLNYVSKSPTDPTSTDSLRCLPLQDSPLPSHVYSCEVNLNQIFGEISAAKSWEEFQRQGEESSFILTDEGLSDRSPYILPIIQRQGFFQFV